MNEFEINGIKYQEIQREQPPKGRRGMSKLLMMAAMYGGIMDSYGPSKASKQRPSVDIVEEFKLI